MEGSFGRPGTTYARTRFMRTVLIMLCLLPVTDCTPSPTGPTAPLDSEFLLAPGQTLVVQGTSLTVRFNGVSGDSRCPADALCIQGGSAQVAITAQSSDSSRDYELLTGDMRPVRHEELTITLVQLTPYPFSARTIQPDEYRATFRVTR